MHGGGQFSSCLLLHDRNGIPTDVRPRRQMHVGSTLPSVEMQREGRTLFSFRWATGPQIV